jgi:hypothetical protein
LADDVDSFVIWTAQKKLAPIAAAHIFDGAFSAKSN